MEIDHQVERKTQQPKRMDFLHALEKQKTISLTIKNTIKGKL